MPQRHCVFCDQDVDDWLPYSLTEAEISEFLWQVGICGSNVRRYACPKCGCNDRERHLKLFFDRLQIWGFFKGALLHMAPEGALSAAIRQQGPSRYVAGDLNPCEPAIEAIDLEAIPYPDSTFDVVICNHILEHVARPGVALLEARRVLKPGGRLICQTPYARRLSATFEDPLLQSEGDRLFFYGQGDHLRLFGIDIERIIRDAGFIGALRPHDKLLPAIDPEVAGVNEWEPFFDFVRD